jgi:hypothetical protein
VKNARNALKNPSMTYLPHLSLVSSSHQIIATQEWSSTMTDDLVRPRAPIQSSSLRRQPKHPPPTSAHMRYAGWPPRVADPCLNPSHSGWQSFIIASHRHPIQLHTTRLEPRPPNTPNSPKPRTPPATGQNEPQPDLR